MKKIFLIVVLLILSNCTLNKVIKHHGVNYLENKQKKLEILISNKNDIIILLGPASVKSTFDNDVWIYIERKTTVSQIKAMGKKEVLSNNVLVLEINNKGLLIRKDFLDINDMNQLKVTKTTTGVINNKSTFVSSVISSLRQKINDPLGKKQAK